ncbi:MAG: hypothetical protein KAG43_10150, partial [Candidatus Marithrix sp.]|nr:hypothetical protein [Candidatus Marithrix sp.]
MQHNVSAEELLEFEADAITEIGNIVLNTCLATCNNVLTEELVTEIPTFIKGVATEIFHKKLASIVLFLHVKFTIQHENINGYVAFVLEVAAIEQLKINIDKYMLKSNIV